ncbi:MAG: hypothetical protein K2Q07_09915 [Burkholderiaceae bacterium]|nr:hypothetical protein [Burkholderiaceae bacterium]
MNSEGAMALMDLVNLLLCTAIGWGCICRLNLLHRGVDWRPRLMFCTLLTGGTAHGMAPWLFKEPAGLGDTILSVAVLASLLLSAHRWRQGAPIGLTGPAEFDDQIREASRL